MESLLIYFWLALVHGNPYSPEFTENTKHIRMDSVIHGELVADGVYPKCPLWFYAHEYLDPTAAEILYLEAVKLEILRKERQHEKSTLRGEIDCQPRGTKFSVSI